MQVKNKFGNADVVSPTRRRCWCITDTGCHQALVIMKRVSEERSRHTVHPEDKHADSRTNPPARSCQHTGSTGYMKDSMISALVVYFYDSVFGDEACVTSASAVVHRSGWPDFVFRLPIPPVRVGGIKDAPQSALMVLWMLPHCWDSVARNTLSLSTVQVRI